MDESVSKAVGLAKSVLIQTGDSGRYPNGEGWGHVSSSYVMQIPTGAWQTIRARLVELESLLAGIDAEQVVTASEKHGDALGVLKDARRWRHARTILPVEYIEDSQREFESYGLPVSEEESIAADEAIDAAMRDSAREVGE